MPPQDDDTIRRMPAARRSPVPPPRVEWGSPAPVMAPPRRGPTWPLIGAGVAAVTAIGLGAWWLVLPPAAPPSAPVAPAPVAQAPVAQAPVEPVRIDPVRVERAPVAAAPPASVLGPDVAAMGAEGATPAPPAAASARLASLPPLLDEAAIAAHRARLPVMLRLASDPAIFVLDFPTLDQQGAALNRVAALVEKAGFPRERLVGAQELAAAMAASGDTPATFYFGHNYRGEALARFFETARRDAEPLSAEEEWVRRQFLLARSLVPAGQEIVLISLAAPGPQMDAAGRATILHHEISHGVFGTRPAYAAHIRKAWRERFSEAERVALRGFLGREGYDTGNEEMMIDEAQAYLLHTPDPRFFTPAHIGLDAAQVERLRGLLREGLPQP